MLTAPPLYDPSLTQTQFFFTRTCLRYVRLYAVASPSVSRLSVICNVLAPYSAGWNFRRCFYEILYLSHLLTFMQNFT